MNTEKLNVIKAAVTTIIEVVFSILGAFSHKNDKNDNKN